MKRLLIWGLLTLLVCELPLKAATTVAPLESPESLWRNALGLYADESEDYVDTLDEHLQELRNYRHKIIQEKFDRRIRGLEITLSKSNMDVIGEIESHIKVSGIESMDDTLLMRMAQLQFERAGFEFSEKMHKYDLALHERGLDLAKGLPDLPTPDYSKVIEFADIIPKTYPNSPVIDRAYYLMGYCYFEMGQSEKGVQKYEKLLSLPSESSLADEVRWRLAEHYFDSENFAKAIGHYKALTEYSNPFRNKALYKWGASHYAQDDLHAAAEIFLGLLRKAQTDPFIPPTERKVFLDESMDYLAHIRARNIEFPIDEETDALVTESLAKSFLRAQDEEGARNAYLHFVRRRPFAAASPRFMDQVIENYEQAGESLRAQQVRARLVGGLGQESLWWEKNRSDIAALVEAQDIFEAQLLAAARFESMQAHKSKSYNRYVRAIELYRSFLRKYDYSPLSYQARFELAELQFFAGKYPEASASYLEVVQSASSDEFKEDAAYGHVASEAKRVGFPLSETSSLKPARLEDGGLAPASAPSEKEKAFLQAAQQYVSSVNQGVRRQKIIYKAAEILFQHNQFEKARTALETSIDETRPNDLTFKALRLVDESYDLENKWEKVTETNRRALSLAETAGGAENTVPLARAGAQALNDAVRLEKGGDYANAAAEFEKFALAFKKSPDAPVALLKAAELHRKARGIDLSDRALDRFTTSYKTNPLMGRAAFMRAQNDESLVDFEGAAIGFEKFAKNFPRDVLVTTALRNAAVLRRHMQNHVLAAADFEKLCQREPGDDEQRFELAEYYLRAGQPLKAQLIYKYYASGKYGIDLRIRGLFGLAQANGDEVSGSCRLIEKLAAQKHSLSAQSIHAHNGCVYLKTGPARDGLQGTRFEGGVDRVKRQVSAFEAGFQSLVENFSAIARSGDREWITRALLDAANIQNSLSVKLMGLIEKKEAPEELKDFVGKYSEMARHKAIDFYQKALEQADGKVYQTTLRKVLQAIRRSPFQGWSINRPEALWPIDVFDTRGFTLETPSEAQLLGITEWPDLKAALDGMRWEEAWNISTGIYEMKKEPIWATLAARAAMELGWNAKAKKILTQALMQHPTVVAAADYLHFAGSDNATAVAFKALRESIDAHPETLVGQAQGFRRKGQRREALQAGKAAVSQDIKFAPAYVVLAQLFTDSGLDDLAQSTLDIGLQNTDDDPILVARKAYMLLSQKLPERALATAEGLLENHPGETNAATLKAFALLGQGKHEESSKTLASALEGASNRRVLLTEALAVALASNDIPRSESYASELEKTIPENPRSNFVLGVYFHSVKKDAARAKEFLTKAKELGESSEWLDVALIDLGNNRIPSHATPLGEKR